MSDEEDRIDGVMNEPPMSPMDRAAIHRLTPDEASVFWTTFVSSNGHHLKTLPSESWPRRMISAQHLRYNWEDDWNSERVEPMKTLLRELHDEDAVVYVCWGQHSCIRTTNGILARNWINFLYDDEGVLVLSETDGYRCVLSHGQMFIG